MVMTKGMVPDDHSSRRAVGDGSFPAPGSRHGIPGNWPIAGWACPNCSEKLPARPGGTGMGQQRLPRAPGAAAQTPVLWDLGVALGPGQRVWGYRGLCWCRRTHHTWTYVWDPQQPDTSMHLPRGWGTLVPLDVTLPPVSIPPSCQRLKATSSAAPTRPLLQTRQQMKEAR